MAQTPWPQRRYPWAASQPNRLTTLSLRGMTDAVEWTTMKASEGFSTGQINQHWLFCIPVQVGPATEYARSLRHWFAFIILLQAVQVVAQLLLKTDLLQALFMAIAAVLGLYGWYQDMNITWVCLWGMVSAIMAIMAIISDLIPTITGVLSFDIFGLILIISVPFVYLMAAAFAWHLYNNYAAEHGRSASSFDPFAKYGKYDPLAKLPMSEAWNAWDWIRLHLTYTSTIDMHFFGASLPSEAYSKGFVSSGTWLNNHFSRNQNEDAQHLYSKCLEVKKMLGSKTRL